MRSFLVGWFLVLGGLCWGQQPAAPAAPVDLNAISEQWKVSIGWYKLTPQERQAWGTLLAYLARRYATGTTAADPAPPVASATAKPEGVSAATAQAAAAALADPVIQAQINRNMRQFLQTREGAIWAMEKQQVERAAALAAAAAAARGAPAPRGAAAMPAGGGGADKHWISEVLGDGAIIKLEDGSVWEVASHERFMTAIWLPTSDVVILDDEKMINVDDSETVEVRRVR